MAKPQCGNCRFYEDARIAGSGWCHHPLRKTTSALIIMVRGNELACRDEWSHSLFEPGKFSPSSLLNDETADARNGHAARPVMPATVPEIAAVVNSSRALPAPASGARTQDVVLDEGAIVTRYTRRSAPEQETLPPIHHEPSIRNAIQRAREIFLENNKQSRPDMESQALAVLELDESELVVENNQTTAAESPRNSESIDPFESVVVRDEEIHQINHREAASEETGVARSDAAAVESATGRFSPRLNETESRGSEGTERASAREQDLDRSPKAAIEPLTSTSERDVLGDEANSPAIRDQSPRKPPIISHETPWMVKRAQDHFVDDREPWSEEPPTATPPNRSSSEILVENSRGSRESTRASGSRWEDIAAPARQSRHPVAQDPTVKDAGPAGLDDQHYSSVLSKPANETDAFKLSTTETAPGSPELGGTKVLVFDDQEGPGAWHIQPHDVNEEMFWSDPTQVVDEAVQSTATVSSFQVAPDAPRVCRLCRDFRPTGQGERGWCLNQWAFEQQRMVEANDHSPCESSVGSWWLPADDFWSGDLDFSAHGQATPLLNRWLPWLGLDKVEEERKQS